MESTGILVSTSRPADNVHLAPSICNAPVRFLESRSLSSGQSKSQSQKRTLVQPIPQMLFLLQSRSAPKSVSVYGSPTVAARVAQGRIRLRQRDAKTIEDNGTTNTLCCSGGFHHIFISPDPFFFFLSFQEYTSILIPLSGHRVLFSRCSNRPMGTECTKFGNVGIVLHLLSLERVPVHPRNRHLQTPGDLTHGQKLSMVFVSVIHHCGSLLRNAARTKHSARSPRSWAGATPRITLGTETCTKVGSLQPNPVFCPRPN